MHKKALPDMLASAGLIAVLFYGLLFWAGQNTTAGNFAILGQTEVLWTFLFFGLLGIESITTQKIIGALCILFSAVLILYQRFTGEIILWDIVIIGACVIPPVGNFFQKRAVQHVSSATQLCFRSLLGGTFMLILSFGIETIPWDRVWSQKGLILLFLNGFIAFGLSKILFLESIKRIDVSKAITLASATPAITIFLAYLFLDEIPTGLQIFGFMFAILGVLFVVREKGKAH